MSSLVVYYSKSGNTKEIAGAIAGALNTKALPLNIISKAGRGTKKEQEEEKRLFDSALEESKNADFVIIGTPAGFQKAHSKIVRFTEQVEAKKVGLFCTHYNQVGTTISGLETILKRRNIPVAGSLEINNLKPGQFKELDKDTQEDCLKRAKEFAQKLV